MNVGNHQTKRMSAAAGGTLDLAHHVHDGTEGLLRLLDRDSAAAADGVRLGTRKITSASSTALWVRKSDE
ncbi:hypothetical protein ACMHYB_22455 [Sorangium sp. So ce1128]